MMLLNVAIIHIIIVIVICAVHHKDLQFLYVKLRGLNSEWKQYGLALRVMYEKLEEIETNPGKPTVRDKMTEVLLLWRGKEMKGKKTWCVVRDAAKQLHNLALAEEIELSKDLTMEGWLEAH